jgi:hypothetical protein
MVGGVSRGVRIGIGGRSSLQGVGSVEQSKYVFIALVLPGRFTNGYVCR